MSRHAFVRMLLPTAFCWILLAGARSAAQSPEKVTVNWGKVIRVSKTAPTLQVVVNPLLRRDSPIHDRVFQVLHDLQCDYVRFVPWFPYPKLAVAELEPPANGRTSWDFSLTDPLTMDFLDATEGHSVILNFSTIPTWMFKTAHPVPYPSDPNEVNWTYGGEGTELQDSTLQQVAGYYARLVSWYTQGGFKDESGESHSSGHHYKIAYWEVLNEMEHQLTPEGYTRIYDAIVQAIRQVDPQIKFVGLGGPAAGEPKYSEYFLDPRNHKPGIPLDFVSYHFYAVPQPGENAQTWQYTFFEQADRFLDIVRYIDSIRQRLSPTTRVDMDELGCILPYDTAEHLIQPIPREYWNLCAATYGYVFAQLAHLGIDVAGESQLVGYPTQFPSVSMVDWTTGQPNARYWVLKLLHENFGPGDKLVETGGGSSAVYVQGFLTRDGKRKILLINKRRRPAEISLPGGAGAHEEYVDQETAFQPPGSAHLVGESLTLGGFELAVVTLP